MLGDRHGATKQTENGIDEGGVRKTDEVVDEDVKEVATQVTKQEPL